MKACMIAAVLFIAVTIIGSMLGATNPEADDIIAPAAGSMVTSAIFLGLMTWENRKQ
ncbi:hypothetical protein [Salibacterium aidingense]|uniref:hypothetical protein n=1 Tax=Salibacterium aidingense TaxID=384933 RepID=UPI0004202030|nr:hypothetical protein [Salibacterium aidingense]